MMGQRGDFDCRHEPFGPVWYFGDEWQCPPQRHVEDRPGLTYQSVFDDLRTRQATGPVFIKDFPHHFLHQFPIAASELFLESFQHSFLIRDPAKVLPSMWDKWPDTELSETGFAEQHELFDRIAQRDGVAPPVIDAEDLLDNTAAMTEKWCEAVGIEFLPQALEWDTSERSAHSWWEGGSWHENLEQSTGLTRQPRDYVDIDAHPRLRELYDTCQPHYDALALHRLTV